MMDLARLLQTLSDSEVEFIIIGGVAAVAHGSARLTQDLDISYSRDPKNLSRLVSALAPHSPYLRGAPPGPPFHWDQSTIERGLNFTLTTTLGDTDLLGEIAGGGSYDDLKPHTQSIEILGVECSCLDLDWLIKVKRAAGRLRDIETVAELEAIRDESEDSSAGG